MKLLPVFALALFAFTSTVRAEISPEKAAEITKMLKVTGMEKMMGQMMGQILGSFKAQDSFDPGILWEKIEASVDTHELLGKLTPIFDKNYSLEDLKAVNAFYATPAGQHMLTAMPVVMQESMAVGQEWGKSLGEKVMKAMEAKKAKGK